MKKRVKQQEKRAIKQRHEHPLQELEYFIDKLVPFMIVALAIVIFLDNPLWSLADLYKYESEILIFDSLIVLIFSLDLIFKWFHIRRTLPFLKHYWLEIIAVFPFYLGFRLFIFLREFAVAGEETQRILHEIAYTRETKVLREAAAVERAEAALREARPFTRALRSITRVIRIIAARVEMVHQNMLKATYHSRERRKH